MKRNSNMPENNSESSNQINGIHLPSFFEPVISNANLYRNIFPDVSPFNQHLINNLTTSLFLEHQNVWSKLITDLGLNSSLVDQNVSFLDKNVNPAEKKRKKKAFSISDLIQRTNDLPLNLSKSKNGLNSQTLSKMSPQSVQNFRKEKSFVNESFLEIGTKEINLIENKLKIPLRLGFKRHTIVKELTSNGVKGDIIYYSPCGRKLRNFQEIDRYLYKFYANQKFKNTTEHLTKENFTFSSKYIVGNYLLLDRDQKESDSIINHNNIKDINHIILNENEILSKISELFPDFKHNENLDPISCEKLNYDFIKNNLNETKNFSHESKQKEKYLLREKKARIRWFNYMVCKYTDKKINSECSNYDAFSRVNHVQVDDMEQKFLSDLPEYSFLNVLLGQENLAWLADALQTIEFLTNFGTTLPNAISDWDDHQLDIDILKSVKNFFLALKNCKYKKELNGLVQIMLKILLDNQTSEPNEETDDDDEEYLVSNVQNFEMNESTFSEILRLYFVKSLKNLKSYQINCKFDLNISADLGHKIQNFIQELETCHFEMLQIETKASILAHLTDDLIQNSSFLQNSSLDQESRQPNAISNYIEETLDKLNKIRQDKVQINHIIRHSLESDEKMQKKKQNAQEEISSLQKQLRSGHFLGQDRFERFYWKLNSFNPILIESYYQDNVLEKNSLSKVLNETVEDLINQVEFNLEKENIIKKFGHLIELNREPFGLKINSDHAQFLSLNFNDIEILVKNIFCYSKKEKIDSYYSSNNLKSSDKWWIYEKNCSQILNSLSTHGFREKILIKNLNQVENVASDVNFDEKLDSNQAKQIRSDKTKILKQIINLENKVINANLQCPTYVQSQTNYDLDITDEAQLVKHGRQRLIKLEKSIDKRYLRYPFSFKKKLSNYKLKISNEIDQILLEKVEQNMNNNKINMSVKLNQDIRNYLKKIDSCHKQDANLNVTNELLRWRRLVSCAKSSSQIMLYLNHLNKYIEWDKSIMKASCHICSLDDNEESLLLCDNCDLGYHTYCFLPKIERIPEGDWYCFKCISKFLGNKQMCYVCGRDNSNQNENDKQLLKKCEKCLCIFHAKCLPNSKFFKTTYKWHCINCLSNKTKVQNPKVDNAKTNDSDKVPKKRGRKRKYPLSDENTANENSTSNIENDLNESIDKSITLSERLTMKKIKQQNESDMYKCRILLNELIKNKYSNYFMERVNQKKYPDYYEIIKEPIDLNTIKEKIKNKIYRNKEQFAYDCRLVFDNCECFNEDDSQIGQAGHKLRAIFETKWLKLFD